MNPTASAILEALFGVSERFYVINFHRDRRYLVPRDGVLHLRK
jgi:hypothetical protein